MQAERKPMEQPVEAHADHKVPLNRIVAVHDVGAQLSIHKSGQQVLCLSASLCVMGRMKHQPTNTAMDFVESWADGIALTAVVVLISNCRVVCVLQGMHRANATCRHQARAAGNKHHRQDYASTSLYPLSLQLVLTWTQLALSRYSFCYVCMLSVYVERGHTCGFAKAHL